MCLSIFENIRFFVYFGYFEDFLKEIYDGFDEEIILVWPQCKIDKNRLDLLIGLKNGSDEINSCLIIEAKVEDPLKKWQLEQYIGKGSCKYLALTKYNEDEVEVKNWTKSTWQDLANFIYLRKYSSKLWNEFVNSMARDDMSSTEVMPAVAYEGIRTATKSYWLAVVGPHVNDRAVTYRSDASHLENNIGERER